MKIAVPLTRLHLVHVDNNGLARLKLRPQFKPNTDHRIVKIKFALVYDHPPTLDELFQDAARRCLNWKPARAYALLALFLAVDIPLFAANGNKVAAGGWFPLALGSAVFIVMITWRRGRGELGRLMAEQALPLDLFLADIGETKDVSVSEPARLAELKEQLIRKYREVREESPVWPAWKFDNREGQRIVWPDYVKRPR